MNNNVYLNELYKILSNNIIYSYNNMDVIKLIQEICTLTKKAFYLEENLIKQVYSNKYDNKVIAIYSKKSRTIEIFLDTLYNYLKEKTKYVWRNSSYNLYVTLLITKIVLHELEHVKQYNMISSDRDDLETNILRGSIYNYEYLYKDIEKGIITEKGAYEYYSKYMKFYTNNYFIAPFEKMADATADGIVFSLSILFDNSDIIRYIYKSYMKDLYNGYQDTNNPTKDYLVGIGKENTYKSLEFYDENDIILERNLKRYSLLEKASLGLYLSDKEIFDLRKGL